MTRTIRSTAPVLLKREAALDTLSSAAAGRGGVVLVTGKAGIVPAFTTQLAKLGVRPRREAAAVVPSQSVIGAARRVSRHARATYLGSSQQRDHSAAARTPFV